MKTILKFFLLIILTTIAFVLVSALFPYSEAFKAANEKADPSALIYVLLTNACICFAIVYIVKHTQWEKSKLMPWLIFSLFFVYSFMAQMETFFFHSAFSVLTNTDIFLIAIANGTLIFAGVPLGIKFFGKKEKALERPAMPSLLVPQLLIKLLLIGFIYCIIYFVFGYFVAWQSEDLRIFYSGHPEDKGFIASLANNYNENPVIYPFQFLRGVLFGIFVLPLVNMFAGQPRQLLTSLILVFLSPGIALSIPNFLFPDTVRWAHFVEMTSSMFLFGLMIWFVYAKLNFSKRL